MEIKDTKTLAEPVELFIDKEDIPETPVKVEKTPTETPKKTRTTVRPIEVILTLAPKNMTPLERVKAIEHYRAQNSKLTFQFEQMTKNAETAYTQFKTADDNYKALKHDADSKLNFAVKAAEMCFKTINLIGGTE